MIKIKSNFYQNPLARVFVGMSVLSLIGMAVVFAFQLLPIPAFYLLQISVAFLFFICFLLFLRPFQAFPRCALIFRWYLWLGFFFIMMDGWCHVAFYLTPYPTVDLALAHADAHMGYSTAIVLAWMHVHPFLNQVCWWAYDSLIFQFLLAPLVLGLLGEQKGFERMTIINLLTMLMGVITYFFFPSNDPVDVERSPYFSQQQIDDVHQFYMVHHHIPNPYQNIGMISFPSYHVIWAMAITIAFIRHRWIFIPLLILNTLLVISTLTTGWHFLIDVLGGIVFVVIALGLTELIFKSSQETYQTVPFRLPGVPADWLLNIAAVCFLIVDVLLFIL